MGRVLTIALAGLASLWAGAVACAQEAAQHGARDGTSRIYMMRGIANFFSYGLDDLSRRLAAAGIDSQVHQFEEWPVLAERACAFLADTPQGRVIIVGHSLGADAAVRMAERMGECGTPPALVITFDPIAAATVEGTAGTFVNYFQSNNGFGWPLKGGKGFAGTIQNIDLAGTPGLNHFNLEKSDALHAEVVARISALLAPPVVEAVSPPARPRPAGRPVGHKPAPAAQARLSAPAPSAPRAFAPQAQSAAAPLGAWGQILETGRFLPR